MGRYELVRQGTTVKATMQIGKAGLTESTVSELRSQLERRELVKVRMLPSGAEGKERRPLFEQLASLTGSELLEVRGGTALFYRPKRKGAPQRSERT